MKRKIAEQITIDASLLPYNTPFLEWIESERNAGRPLLLATASDRLLADEIARHLDIFDQVIASDGQHNLKGVGKLEALKEAYGTEFAYAGNSRADLPIWRECREAIVVNAKPDVLAAARAGGNVTRVFEREPIKPASIISVLHLQDWLKNLLIFAVPLGLQVPVQPWLGAAAFLSFSFCGSGAAMLGDLINLERDRRDRVGSSGAIASGAFPMEWAFVASAALIAIGAAFALPLPPRFAICLAGFVVLTLVYSRRTMVTPLVLRLAAGWFAFVQH